MSHLGYDLNEYGTMFSRHRCDFCGDEYNATPAIAPEHPDSSGCARPPWLFPERGACPSYEEAHDMSKMLREGTADLHAQPVKPKEST